MENVRIESSVDGRSFLVDITCICGRNGLRDEATGETSYKHVVPQGAEKVDGVVREVRLICSCGRKYGIQVQRTHIHVYPIALSILG